MALDWMLICWCLNFDHNFIDAIRAKLYDKFVLLFSAELRASENQLALMYYSGDAICY